MSLKCCQRIDLPKITDARGNLAFIEGDRHTSFEINRVFYLYEVPGRGPCWPCAEDVPSIPRRHVRQLRRCGPRREGQGTVPPEPSYYALHLTPMVWREIDNFSSGSVCLILASEPYDERTISGITAST